jgi:hypothetical protein
MPTAGHKFKIVWEKPTDMTIHWNWKAPEDSVRTDFGKFWKLVKVFSRTLKILENQVL